MSYESDRQFEADVCRSAEAIWGLKPGSCQPEHYSNEKHIRELDGIVRLRDVVHLIMATTSTRLEKCKEDIKKLNDAESVEGRKGSVVAKWFITSRPIEAEHHRHARDHRVTALTLSQFRARFFDGRDYIGKRRVTAFGSARNLSDGTITIPDSEYVPLPMTSQHVGDLGGRAGGRPSSSVAIRQVADQLLRGETVVLSAPFGSGKSLSVREIFTTLSQDYATDRAERVPIALNLREHWGSLYADEILERHARAIGFTPKENLTVAWRAGMTTLMIDGFDEIASQAIVRLSDRNFLREVRAQALIAVKDLVANSPAGTGILLAGRDHYFDTLTELAHALGLTARPFHLVRLDEFTEDQAAEFLKKYIGVATIPGWLPRKPLILGYLAHKRLLQPIMEIDASRGYGYAWDNFLALVCDREAAHERASMDSNTVRRVLERLACDVRGTTSGTGPISGVDLAEAYRYETGDVAGEGVLMQLQRLPGLTSREQDPSVRSFVDEDLLAALQGSAIARVVLESATPWSLRTWLSGLSSRAVSVAAHIIRAAGADAETAIAAALRLASGYPSSQGQQVCADILSVALELAEDSGYLNARSLFIEGANLGKLDLEEMRIDSLTLKVCAIHEVRVGARTSEGTLQLTECMFARVVGVSSASALPANIFLSCESETFDDASTTAAVMRLEIAAGLKALVSILRKLYLQSGGGRKLSALKRGLTDLAVSKCVDDVIVILEQEDLVTVYGQIAHPNRRNAARVHRILQELSTSRDPAVLGVLTIS